MRAVAKVTKGITFRGGQLRESKQEPPNKRLKKIPARQLETNTINTEEKKSARNQTK